MGKDDHVSRPALKPELNVLCIDGTKTTDSSMFAYQVIVAGKTMKKPADRVGVQNLMSLVSTSPNGTVATPAWHQPPPKAEWKCFPFDQAMQKTLPIKKEPLPNSTNRIAEVLMPGGEVTSANTTFSDPLLGANEHDRVVAAHRNSEMLKRLCLGPGVSKVGTPDAYVDFATASNACTDILYLSGHGSMAGTICGESSNLPTEAGYIRYFELLNLLRKEFLTLGPTLVSPMWIVVGACYSMRPAHAEIWLRYLNKLSVPLRGFLGYQMTSPLADTSAEINRQFANALATGATFLGAWKTANENTGNTPRWTAMVFDHAKDDTLTTLRDIKRGTAPATAAVPAPGSRILRFYDTNRTTPGPVQVNPPLALIVFHKWNPPFASKSGSIAGWWTEMLVTNVDFDQASFATAAGNSGGKVVTNGSWSGGFDATHELFLKEQSLTTLTSWDQELCPNQVYRIAIFPPFNSNCKTGYQDGDTIELSMVHVRQDYSHPFAFLTVFDILQINELTADPSMYSIPPPQSSLGKVQAATVRNRIGWERPANRPPFEPLSITVRFKPPAATYLWFWFAVKIVRPGVGEIFPTTEFDNYILTLGSPHGCAGSTFPKAADLPHR
jgi:hypothetical protein